MFLKIRDRLVLGMVAGIGGTIAKNIFISGAKKMNMAEFDGVETAAGMFVPAHKITTKQGRIVGHIGNTIMGAVLGTSIVYLFSLTGKDKAIIKGTAAGSVMWLALYGALAGIGATTVRPAMPNTMISQFLGHSLFGGVASLIATRLGDDKLYDGRIPMTIKSTEQVKSKNSNMMYQVHNKSDMA